MPDTRGTGNMSYQFRVDRSRHHPPLKRAGPTTRERSGWQFVASVGRSGHPLIRRQGEEVCVLVGDRDL